MKRITRLATSWTVTFTLVIFYAILLAIATFVENSFGSQMARTLVYNQPFCYVLLLLLVVQFLVMSRCYHLWHQHHWGTLLLHLSFVVILAGALTTHLFSREGLIHVREGEESNLLIDSHGKTLCKLPFTVCLDDFRLSRYPGSESPSSYESFLRIRTDKGETKEQVAMNKIVYACGYRLYQSSYDIDEKGTILTANQDVWGMRITYTGYALLLIGMLLTPFHPQSRFRALLRQLRTPLLVACLLIPVTLHAEDDISQKLLQYAITREQADEWADLLVQTSEGRIEPIDTYSSQILRKLCRSENFLGLNPEQVVLGIMLHPDYWARVSLLRQTDQKLAVSLGLPQKKYLRLVDLFDDAGRYKLTDQVNEAYAHSQRSTQEKNLLKLDEKANILYALMQHQLFALFPLKSDASGKWYSPGDDLSRFTGKDSLLVAGFLPMYLEEVDKPSHLSKAKELLSMLRMYQLKRSRAEMPSQLQIKAELWYNHLHIFSKTAVGYMLSGLLLLMFSIGLLLTSKKWIQQILGVLTSVVFLMFLCHTAGLILRWYIAGRAPWANAYESMVYVAWATALSGMLFIRRSSLTLSAATIFAGILLFVANLNFMDPEITPLVPVLKSYWLMIHVAVITASYGFFGMSFLLGVITLGFVLCQSRYFRLQTQVHRLRVINELSIYIGLFLLTAGIFLGAVWANVSWGRYWGWDPKETWALISMLVYVLVLHARYLPSLKSDKAFSLLAVMAMLSIAMTYFGVNFYLTGLHSYGAN